MILRTFTYRQGHKVCPGCDKPLDDMRRDARGHDACMRAIRRRTRGTTVRGVRGRQTPGSGHVCPECGGHVLLVRVTAFGPLTDAQSVVLDGERSVSGGKRATCISCESSFTVARTRAAA